MHSTITRTPPTLQHFILRARVFSLYRTLIRATHNIPKETALEMRKYIREEFEKQRHVRDTVHPLMETRDRPFSHFDRSRSSICSTGERQRSKSSRRKSIWQESDIYIRTRASAIATHHDNTQLLKFFLQSQYPPYLV